MRIVFAGTPAFAVPSLEVLIKANHSLVAVYTQPDRPAGRGQKLQASPVKQCAIEHGIPVFQPTSLRNEAEQQHLSELNPDLMIVVAYGLILPRRILEIPRMGCVNVHASLLPRWRGAAPIQRAIEAGDTETGITLMQMDEGLDTGDMLSKSSCPIDPMDTAASLHDKLATLGAETLIQALAHFATLERIPQDAHAATYAAKITRAEARIDWQHPAEHIARQIRAFNPWPGAFTGPDEAPLKIWQARLLSTASSLQPGQIVQARPEGLDIATGQGLLRIEKLQMPGGRVLSAGEMLNARRDTLVPGSWLADCLIEKDVIPAKAGTHSKKLPE